MNPTVQTNAASTIRPQKKAWSRPTLVAHGDACQLTEHRSRRTGTQVGRGGFGGAPQSS